MSPADVPHMEKVFSIWRQIFGRSPTDHLNDLDEYISIWCIFMNVTLQAAVSSSWSRLFLTVKRITKNQLLKSAKQLFQMTESWSRIRQKSVVGPRLFFFLKKKPTWKSTTLLCDKEIEITNAKTYVFADSVLCLESISDQPVEAWNNKIKWYSVNRYLKNLNRIVKDPMESEWKIIQDSLHWAFSKRFKNWRLNCNVNQSSSKGGSSSCQCTTTLYGENEETQKNVLWILLR